MAAGENCCQAMVKHFPSCRDSQGVLRVQLKARGNGGPSHKHQKPMHHLVAVQSLLTVAQYGCHLHKDNGAKSFQCSRLGKNKYILCGYYLENFKKSLKSNKNSTDRS